MPRQIQQRDPQGRFTISTQPQQQPPPTPAPASTTGPTRFQCALVAVSSPFHLAVPILEAVARATAIFQESLPDTPTIPLPDSEDLAPSLTRYVPPLHYVTDPPIARLDFGTPRPNGDAPLVPQQPAFAFMEEEVFFANSEQPQPPMLLPPRPPRSMPQPPRQLTHTRPAPWPPCAPSTSQAPPDPPPPTVIMSAPAIRGIAGMPYLWAKFAPYFSGEVNQDIEDFLDEYEEKANDNNLTRTQKVETVIRYVVKTQHHIWKSLPGYIDRDWDDLRAQLRQQYVNPSTEGVKVQGP